MNYAVIDSDNYAASGIEVLTFPGGEPHVKVPPFTGKVLHIIKARTLEQTFVGALVSDALSRQRSAKLYTFLPYFPGARQDRSDGSCGHTADLIGLLFKHLPRVCTFDVHSDAAMRSIDSFDWRMDDLNFEPMAPIVGVIAPDAGASDRAFSFMFRFAPHAKIIQCAKKRDPHTGALSGYEMPELPTRSGHYVVIDDICDGGGTFNLLAEAFRQRANGSNKFSLELVVSHGIFSKGIDALSDMYARITTTDSWCRDIPNPFREVDDPSRLVVLPLAQLNNRIMGEVDV